MGSFRILYSVVEQILGSLRDEEMTKTLINVGG